MAHTQPDTGLAPLVTVEDTSGLVMRMARASDGAAMWELARDTGVLDVNSPYAYLMVAEHFGDTCVVAEQDGALLGFVAAFRPPRRREALFVWQIGVAAVARGRGLATKLLHALLDAPGSLGVRWLQATVTPSNIASRRLFRGMAEKLGVRCTVCPGFPAEWFPGTHEPEELFHIGPLAGRADARRRADDEETKKQ